MRILVAGCGYVGSAFALRRVEKGDETFGLRRDVSRLPAGVAPVAADLADAASLRGALPGELDAVVYAASADGRDESAYRRAYLEGLSNLLGCFPTGAGAPRLFFTSSTSVHGQDAGEWVDEDSPAAAEHFRGRILLEAEALVHERGGCVLRLGGIYGPGRTRLLDSVREGRAKVPGQPQFTNRIHRDDAAAALDHLLDFERRETLYLGVDDDPAERGVVLRWLAAKLGVAAPEPESGSPVEGATGKRCRNRRLRATGFVPAYPSFRDGYAEMIAAQTR